MQDDFKKQRGADRPSGVRLTPDAEEAAAPFFSEDERPRIEERLLYIAQRRYRFREDVATKLVKDAVDSYLEAYGNYAAWVDHRTQLLHLLRSRAREHIQRQIRLTAQGNAIRQAMPEADVAAALADGTLDEIVSHDVRRLVLEALCELRPKAREALRSLRGGISRFELLGVIQSLGLNKSEDASSLGAYRSRIHQILARCGIKF